MLCQTTLGRHVRVIGLAFLAVQLFPATGAIARPIQAQSVDDFESLSRSATAAREAGHPADAILLYRRALQLRPDWVEGWWYLGTLLYDADQFRDAIPAFQKVAEIAPQAPDTENFLGLCEFEVADYNSALQHLEKGHASASSQDDPQLARVVSYHLALLLNRDGQFDRALAVLSKDFAQGAPPSQVAFAFGLAQLHIPLLPGEVDASKEALIQNAGQLSALVSQGHAAQSLGSYVSLIQQNPDVPYLHSAYAAALEATGQPAQAFEQIKLDRIPKVLTTVDVKLAALYANEAGRARLGLPADSTKASAPAIPDDPNAAWQQATQLFAAARYAEAIPHLKSWLVSRSQDGTAWAMLGLSEFETRDYANALLHLEKGASLGLGGSSDSVRIARYRLALLLIRNAQFDRAATLLVPEAEGNSLAPEIQFALGLALLHKKMLPQQVPPSNAPLVQSAGEISLLLHQSKYDAAFPKLQQLIQKYPSTPLLHYVYGLGLASLSRYEDAETQFNEESRISPQSELPYVQRAFVELQTRRPADALTSAQRAVQLAPDSAEAHYVLGRSLLESGKYQEASEELQIAARLNPGSPEVHFNLAKAYARLNRREDAERERATFARLNAEIEYQRSHQGSQAYGAAHTASELSQSQAQPQSPRQQAPPPK
ncbi:MAG TPA: tetratricopeptide repeat protein [Candidatus Acidoferrum sp.]